MIRSFVLVRDRLRLLATGAFVLGALFLTSCASIPPQERDSVRADIDATADELVAKFSASDPEFAKALSESAGYFAGVVSNVKVPLLGGATGAGVLVSTQNDERYYLNLTRFDVGVGLAADRQSFVVLTKTQKAFDDLASGKWTSSLGAESQSSSSDGLVVITPYGDYEVFVSTDSGVTVVATARLSKITVNTELTDMAIAETSIPVSGYRDEGRQTKGAPRTWEQKLPFLAQKVIDEGYDLPKAYGIGLTYANVDQAMILQELKVGLGGGDKESFDFVSFENARAKSESVQLKADAWLFPFMNVFAMVGRLDGEAPIDVVLDGNGLLEQSGANCGGLPINPLCPLLKDKTIILPLDAPFRGTTYGLGTILAGGWNGWFVTIPFNATYADMDTTNTSGLAYTVTPRAGRLVELGRAGTLALFAGGNYLKADLEVDGTVFLPVPGGDSLQVDYTIDQRNTDEWNLVLGGNWDISKRWSVSAEYNGFIGSRDAFISTVTWRY